MYGETGRFPQSIAVKCQIIVSPDDSPGDTMILYPFRRRCTPPQRFLVCAL